MATKDDRRAAVILLALAAAGLAVRLLMSTDGPPGEVAYHPSGGARPGRDSVAARAARLAQPLERGETIDIDRATADELMRLPRIGPALAARIVTQRETEGPFGSLEALGRVPGIGPTTLKGLAPHAQFSGPSTSPVVAPVSAVAPVSLNTASVDELSQLPGLGPARARAIVDDRQRHGPYRRLDDLRRVRGIGPAIVAGLRGRVRVP